MAIVMQRKAGPVVVDWQDAAATTSWHRSRKKARKAAGLVSCKTIGWLVDQTDTHVTVAQSVTELGQFGELMTIPNGCIVQVAELDLPQEKKPRAGFTIPT